VLLPALAGLSGPAYGYMQGWVNQQGPAFAASVSAARVPGGASF
jgi:hypothetical protein